MPQHSQGSSPNTPPAMKEYRHVMLQKYTTGVCLVGGSLLLSGIVLALLGGCTPKEEPLPPVPHPPEDLSTWSVPTLVQPPPPPEPVPVIPKDKATSAEQ